MRNLGHVLALEILKRLGDLRGRDGAGVDVVAGLGTFGTEAWHGVDENYVFLLGEAPKVGEAVVVLVVADYRLVAPL